MLDAVLWILCSYYEALSKRLSSQAGAVTAAVLIFVVFWIAAAVFRAFVFRAAKRDSQRADVLRLIGRAGYVGGLILGAVTALGTAGIDLTGVIAGLGLTGFAVGFALRDLLATTVAGLMILLTRPFQKGERIKVGEFEGVVAPIDLRYTTLVNDGRRFLIPNSTVLNSPVTVLAPHNGHEP